MENWWISWQLAKIKQKELLQEAARFRLLQNARKGVDRSGVRVHHSRAFEDPECVPYIDAFTY